MILPIFLTFSGLALLLFGLKTLRNGLEKFAGSNFQQTLMKLTSTLGKGFLTGIVATGLLQSSTALTLMAVSFVDAQIISFRNALGLILGSNIGTTITPQILAFPIKEIALWLILNGLLGYVILKGQKRYLFSALAGLGVMLLSLSILESAMIPLSELPQVQSWLQQIGNNNFFAVLVGTVLSALLHSSSATTGIAMVLTQEGWITLPTALALLFGANIGTCFTALIVSFFTSRAAQRVAIFHVLINIFGVIIFYPFLDQIANLLTLLGGSLSRQVANAHTIFNVVSALIALPLLPSVIRLLEKY
ncbi:MAG: Na/Pi-cotransporter [Gracilibacter sp. BRH_c7a]|nr:MAG: Na/Pi-cotransporter [Gracilibacter sp. BRH_c7a]